MTLTGNKIFNMFPIWETVYGEKLVRLSALELFYLDNELSESLEQTAESERTYTRKGNFAAVWYNLGYNV